MKRTRKSKVWRMLSRMDLALGFFPLPAEISDWTQHEEMMLKLNKISLTDLEFAVSQLF